MSVTITWVTSPEADIDFYRVYRSDNKTPAGPYTLIGTSDHDELVAYTEYTDLDGEEDDYYKVTPVNLSGIEGPDSDSEKAISHPTTRVVGVILDMSDKPVAGVKVEAKLSVSQAEVLGDVNIVAPYTQVTYSNKQGAWYLDLYPNSLLSPAGTEYLITIHGIRPPQYVTVPEGTIVKYSALVSL